MKTAQEIISKASCLKNFEYDTYHKSYQYFVQYFKDKKTITEFDLVIGANFVYGWMPTILDFKSGEFSEAVVILNRSKNSALISSEDLLILKKLINNSLVGASKLLHFINPDNYAIWDSKVLRFLNESLVDKKQKIDSMDSFLLYLDICKNATLHPEFDKIHMSFVDDVGYNFSKLRTIEQIMFLTIKNKEKEEEIKKNKS